MTTGSIRHSRLPARRLFAVALLLLLHAAPVPAQARAQTNSPGPAHTLTVIDGTDASGAATERWLTILRKRLPPIRFDSIAAIVKPLSEAERAWAAQVRSRAAAWPAEILAIAAAYAPAEAPVHVTIVLGNRGAEDAFTHDGTTIGFDLAALQHNYGDASLPENAQRIDRFFRHEYVHLMQKARALLYPYVPDSPLRLALVDIWSEGLGNRESLAGRWIPLEGRASAATIGALDTLGPRFVARLSALACTTPERAGALMADLASGPFDRKWGALPVALWLADEYARDPEALRRFVVAGPDGVWALAGRHLSPQLAAVLNEARVAAELCR